MTRKTKSRDGANRAASKTTDYRNYISIKTRFKALIVGAACWGLLPFMLAEWIIRMGGMRDD